MTFSTLSQANPVCEEAASLASCSYNSCYKDSHAFILLSHRNKVLREITKKSGGRGTLCGCCTNCMRRAKVVSVSHSFRRFRNILSEFFHRLNFWHKTLKVIAGEFGTSVLSYFIFLKWLLNFNIFSFLVNFGFITIPQLVTAEPNNLSFTGLELLTGAEDLAEENNEAPNFSVKERIVRILIHLGSWAASLGTAVAACAGVYFLSVNNLQLFMKGYRNDLESQAAMLVLAIITSLLNVVFPFFYSWLGNLERFQNPKHKIYVTIARIIMLKISIIGILCYYWLNVVAASESQCWETLVGQDIYRLLLVDFIFCLLGSFFGEFLRRIVGTTVCISLGVPEFDIGRSVLDLIYAQTLTWIGILFSPLMPGIQMIAFSIVFYVKKVSLMRNCQPPRKAWRAAQMTTFFMFLLFFPSLIGVLSVIAITVWSLKPSKECGPFRGLPSIYAAISEWVKILENYIDSKWVVWIYYNLIASKLFFFILSVPILVIAYIYWQILKGRRTMAKILLQQIINKAEDKAFVLQELRMLQKIRNPSAPRRQDQQRISSLDRSSMPPAQQEPDYPGRTFDRNRNASYDELPFSEPFYGGFVMVVQHQVDEHKKNSSQ
ncbi:hypothetical protein CIB84_004548, partial [Bambusicola thoracicus]